MTTVGNVLFNPPPGWPQPPRGWRPPAGWVPDPRWPQPPDGWQLWVPTDPQLDDTGTAEKRGKDASSTLNPSKDSVLAPSEVPARVAYLEAENAVLKERLASLGSTEASVELDDQRILQDVGIYRYHHPLENATLYIDRLHKIEGRIAEVVKSGRAIVKSNTFTFDNSLAKGRRMSNDLGKLMLRAYNSEADSSIRSLKVGNVVTAKQRLEASRAVIAKLGGLMEMHISDDFHNLRIEEIELTADWLMKKQTERESERENRARLREERRVERELAEEKAQLDKERSHLENALDSLRILGSTDVELEQRLAAVDEMITQNDFRAANIRAGYVYVISNRGAFGDHILKIGLTRRLEPTERVDELSGAAVPFRFDIHTLFFSEDAVTLENELHGHFASRAVNKANTRKEFFFATPGEVRDVLTEKVGNLLEFSEQADATEFLQSVGHWPESNRPPRPAH